MDVKKAKELSDKYSKIVNNRKLKTRIRYINKGIKKRCKQGFDSYSYIDCELRSETTTKKIIEHYNNKGFEVELIGNRVFIKWN